MAKKKTTTKKEYHDNFIQEQRITDTLELNYMPYAMSVMNRIKELLHRDL